MHHNYTGNAHTLTNEKSQTKAQLELQLKSK